MHEKDKGAFKYAGKIEGKEIFTNDAGHYFHCNKNGVMRRSQHVENIVKYGHDDGHKRAAQK